MPIGAIGLPGPPERSDPHGVLAQHCQGDGFLRDATCAFCARKCSLWKRSTLRVEGEEFVDQFHDVVEALDSQSKLRSCNIRVLAEDLLPAAQQQR